MRRLLVFVFAFSVLAMGSAYAQTEATINGTVVDDSGGVLPGVTVTATEINTGRQFFSITDERGEYRMPSVEPGTYSVTAELPGFGTVEVPALELLVGQNAAIPFTLGVAGLEELADGLAREVPEQKAEDGEVEDGDEDGTVLDLLVLAKPGEAYVVVDDLGALTVATDHADVALDPLARVFVVTRGSVPGGSRNVARSGRLVLGSARLVLGSARLVLGSARLALGAGVPGRRGLLHGWVLRPDQRRQPQGQEQDDGQREASTKAMIDAKRSRPGESAVDRC